MSHNYQFREAQPDDISLLTEWTLELMKHESVENSLEVPLKSDVDEKIAAWLSTLITSDNALYIIAETEEKVPCGCILGILQLAPNDFVDCAVHGLIQMIWVTPEFRRDGLARQLLEHMEQTFQNLEVPYCEISYSTSNEEAKGFWQTHGYEAVSTSCRKFF